VQVDADLCQGHAVCVSEAPEVFRIDARTGKVALVDDQPPEELRAKIEAAARYCPTRAISLGGSPAAAAFPVAPSGRGQE
jgi:ferredoxin